ncbi:carbohydrate kinase family protein (plasmid) [Streptomyces sp. BI20]|uniref:carbohydrate kinase family protein n=1 Tax=Streptomyces sp. BI20 TaxID=3403460 RepID=UPI003C714540
MILVAGEALVDLVPVPGAPQAPPVARPGGGPYNTAVALGRLGEPTAFCSRISTDAHGRELIAGLRAAGVDTTPVLRGPEPTPLAVSTLGPDGSARYEFRVEGTADRLFTAPARLPEGTRAVSFGTCSLVLEPGASAYEELMRRAAGAGLLTVVDPNVRPALVPDAEEHRARFRSWLPHTGLLKLSEEDAERLGGDPGAWLAAGAGAVVLTRGERGMSAFPGPGRRIDVPAVRVPVVDTIGAGDTVTAALLHGLARHDALYPTGPAGLGDAVWTELLTFAARAAALTCSRPGAQPPTAAEVAEAALAGR